MGDYTAPPQHIFGVQLFSVKNFLTWLNANGFEIYADESFRDPYSEEPLGHPVSTERLLTIYTRGPKS